MSVNLSSDFKCFYQIRDKMSPAALYCSQRPYFTSNTKGDAPMKKAVIYARYSSDMQREESIDAQVRACTYYARQYQYEIVHVYADRAQSGKRTKNREQFLQMINDASDGGFEVILVHKLNRFGRNTLEVLEYKNNLEDMGIELISVTERLESTPEGKLMLIIIAGMNEFYSDNLSQEVMKGLKENAYQCKFTGGVPALGYKVDPESKKLIIDEREAPIVQLIFRRYSNGWSYNMIIDELTRLGYHTKYGKPFGKNSLFELLRNEKYIGVYTFNRAAKRKRDGTRNYHVTKDPSEIIRIPGGCPALIDKETFEKVQNIMSENRKMSLQQHGQKVYILSGKLFCANCGARMYGNCKTTRGKTHFYYVCSNSWRKHKCSSRHIPAEELEDEIIEMLQTLICSPEFLQKVSQQLQNDAQKNQEITRKQRESAAKRLQSINFKIKNLLNLVSQGIDFEEVGETLSTLKQEKETLMNTLDILDNLPPTAEENLPHKLSRLSSLEAVEQAALIRQYVDKIFVLAPKESQLPVKVDIYLRSDLFE